jgi:hypothetical protein
MYVHETEDNRNPRRFDHTYLLFCSQLLGVISNLAALYTCGAAGDSFMRAAVAQTTFATQVPSGTVTLVGGSTTTFTNSTLTLTAGQAIS